MKKSLKIGMLGLGTVGSGVAVLLDESRKHIMDKENIELSLEKVLVRDISLMRSVKVNRTVLTTDAAKVIDEPSIDIIIELIGGLEPALSYVTKALRNGKHVVTANKDLMAVHGRQLFEEAAKSNRNVFYEGSVGGGIPLVKPLKNLIPGDVCRLYGIINGATNFILTRISQDGVTFEEALVEAQKMGFAESNPAKDLLGNDSAYKLAILAGLVFGVTVNPRHIYRQGIDGLQYTDINAAREIGYIVKLLVIGDKTNGGLSLRVHPTLVPENHFLANVFGEYNALFVEGKAIGKIAFYGKGAGASPTASAVLSDTLDAAKLIVHKAPTSVTENNYQQAELLSINDTVNYYYLRFMAEERSGFQIGMEDVLAEYQINYTMRNKRNLDENLCEFILTTGHVLDSSMRSALVRLVECNLIKPNYSLYHLLN